MLKHVNSTTYYPQGNGQAKYTNKIIGRLLRKLVNEKKIDWDEHLSTVLFSYQTTYKVATSYTTYQLVYGLHPLMPTKYVLLATSGDQKDEKSTKVLTTKINNQKSYMTTNWKLKTMWEPTNGVDFYGVNKKNIEKSSNLGNLFYGFPREKKHILANSRKDGLVHSKYNISYPIILSFLFLLTILNQTQYWSMLISSNHIHMRIKH